MAENYTIPENPIYNENIRKIQNGDYVDAENVLNPVLQQIIKNQAAHQKNKADLVNGKIPVGQIPSLSYIPTSAKGAADGVASLGSDKKIPTSQIPALPYVPTTRTVNNKSLIANITLTAADVGARSSSWLPTTAQVGAIPTAQKGAANGVAELGGDGLVPKAQLPAINGKRTCRFVVGTSVAGWTADDCDYLCDGVDDDVELNQAINDAISFGGGQEIVILRGDYNLSNPLEYLEGITLIGEMDTPCNFKNTRLNLANGVNITIAGDFVGLRNLYILGGSILNSQPGFGFCHFENCNASFEGKFNYSSFVRCNGYINLNDSEYVTISYCTFPMVSTHACSNVIIVGCNEHFEDSRGEISITSTSHSVITGNIVKYIHLSSNSHDNIITGNNVFVPSGNQGIWMAYADRNAIIGNLVLLDDTADISTTDTIRFGQNCNNNLIANNLIFGKNYITNGGTGNTFVNNKYS